MNNFLKFSVATTVWICLTVSGFSRAPNIHHSIPLSDPSRPGVVEATMLSGSITVKGYSGKRLLSIHQPLGKKTS
jgi:hypothetical protein